MKALFPRVLVLAAACAALPAFAQPGEWTGGCVGGHAGVVMDPDDNNDRFLFDTNQAAEQPRFSGVHALS